MTRKVRCGNTQKHTKMPEDATPWEELSRDIKANTQSRKNTVKKIKREQTDDLATKTTEESINVKEEITFKEEAFPKSKFIKAVESDDTSVQTALEESEETKQEDSIKSEKKTNTFPKNFKSKEKLDKKKFYMEKLQQRRLENGVTLLAPNQERKLYLMKKKLRQKGYPPEMIKEITRKNRRSEENKFRKTFTTKICFHCRERGHLLLNCPQRLGESKQVTGICFKCGSTEHVSYRCRKNVEGYPLAKCFICKEQGHISKECPKNNRGVYIKGGSCRECGNVNHLQKDCPLLVKKKENPPVSLYTIQDGTSIDAEIIEEERPPHKKKLKKPKIVKF